jgi:hypothetical protein
VCVHPLTFVPDLQDMGRFGLSHVIPLPYHPSSFVNLPNGAQIVAMPLTTGLSGGNNFAWQKVDGTTRADSVTCLWHQAMCPLPAPPPPPPPARARPRRGSGLVGLLAPGVQVAQTALAADALQLRLGWPQHTCGQPAMQGI